MRSNRYIGLDKPAIAPEAVPTAAPVFLQVADLYSVLCQHLDLEELAKLAMTSRLGRERFKKILLMRPELILNALIKMHKSKIAAFLRHYPAITELILSFGIERNTNPATYVLWTMVANINDIDQQILQSCIEHYNNANHMRIAQMLQSIQSVIGLSLLYRNFNQANLEVDNQTGSFIDHDCYLNLRGLQLVNIARADANILLGNIDLSWANLTHSDLHRVYFKDINMTGADLSHARLTDVSILGNVDFSHAQLRDTRLDMHTLMLRQRYGCRIVLDGANFSGARFFPSDIMTTIELTETLDHLPHTYLQINDEQSAVDSNNHHMILRAVLSDLIRTINQYTEDDFTAYLLRPYVDFFRREGTTLQEKKVFLYQAAQDHHFFRRTNSMLMFQINDLFSCGFSSNKPTFKNPSLRAIQREINLIQEEANPRRCQPGCMIQ